MKEGQNDWRFQSKEKVYLSPSWINTNLRYEIHYGSLKIESIVSSFSDSGNFKFCKT